MYRTIDTAFWGDRKVSEDFSADERYLYLYLMTNNRTRLCGCYEITCKAMAFETGLPADKVKKALSALDEKHHVIMYDPATSEVLLLNWAKYQWNTSPKTLASVRKDAASIHNESYKEAVLDLVNRAENGEERDTLSIPYQYPIEGVSIPFCSVSNTKPKSKSDSKDKEKYIEIVNYLNTATGSNYKPLAKETVKHINARLSEGYTIDDFKTVIDKKARDWIGTEQEKYLRPETLFGSKFEGYLNQHVTKKSSFDVLAQIAAGGP